jgi:hypothetical protein
MPLEITDENNILIIEETGTASPLKRLEMDYSTWPTPIKVDLDLSREEKNLYIHVISTRDGPNTDRTSTPTHLEFPTLDDFFTYAEKIQKLPPLRVEFRAALLAKEQKARDALQAERRPKPPGT